MKKALMCAPTHFNVNYDINPWMTGNIGQVDQNLALAQWTQLYQAMCKLCDVQLIEGASDLPDMVFTANAGMSKKRIAIVSNFACDQRSPESYHWRTWFLNNKYIVGQCKNRYEGQGDHLVDAQRRHWMGWGFRTDAAAGHEMEVFLDEKIRLLKLVDSRWYHLDTCFAPLPNGELVWYPPAFDARSQQLIKRSFNTLIEVTQEDAEQFACNLVAVGDTLLLPRNKTTSNSLYQLGYQVQEFDLSQFILAGGAAKCLVLSLP